MSDQNKKHSNGQESESSVSVSEAAAGSVSDSQEQESPSLFESDAGSAQPDSADSISEADTFSEQGEDNAGEEDAFDEMDLFGQVLSEEGSASGVAQVIKGSVENHDASGHTSDASTDASIESSGPEENSSGEPLHETYETVLANEQGENKQKSAGPLNQEAVSHDANSNHDDSLDVDDILAGLSPDLKNDLEADISEAESADGTNASVDNLVDDVPDNESAGADSGVAAGEGESADADFESPGESSGDGTDAEEEQDKDAPDNNETGFEHITTATVHEKKDASRATGEEEGVIHEDESMSEIDLFGDDADELSLDDTASGGEETKSNAGEGSPQSFQDHLESAKDTDGGGEVEIELEPMKVSSDDQPENVAKVHEEEARSESQKNWSSVSSTQESPGASNDESLAGGEPESAPALDAESSGFDDDIGISLSDDELWDESEDEIPLLDEELSENEVPSPGVVDDLVEESPRQEVAETVTESEPAADLTEEPVKNVDELPTRPSEEALIVIGGKGPRWLPWLLTAVSSGFLLGGIFVLWGMLTSAPDTAVTHQTALPNSVTLHSRQSSAADQTGHLPVAVPSGEGGTIQDVRPSVAKPALEALVLAPFIIPVQRQGELVFFKLTVELIVPDIKTKQELKKREAWVRDAIYTELKGIEVGPGLKGDFLLNYRRPLIKRIEKELAPLEIKDVRLMGYVLK